MAFTPPPLASETIAHIGSFPLRNSMIMSWLAVLVLVIAALVFRKKGGKLIPRGFQNFVEAIVEGMFDFFTTITQSREQTKRFFPVIATIFIYVLFANWMGLLPGVGSIGIWEMEEGHEVFLPLLRSAYSDINLTLSIALISVFMTQVFGLMGLGFKHYAGKFFVNPFKDFIGSFVGLLELISEFAKVISFSFRLFGNVFAGEVLLAVIGFLLPFIAPLPFYGLELFVGFIQALVFSLLTAVFMKMAVTSHGDDSSHHEPQHA